MRVAHVRESTRSRGLINRPSVYAEETVIGAPRVPAWGAPCAHVTPSLRSSVGRSTANEFRGRRSRPLMTKPLLQSPNATAAPHAAAAAASPVRAEQALAAWRDILG